MRPGRGFLAAELRYQGARDGRIELVPKLPQIVSIPAYTVLIVGTLWSAWKMRGRPELRERFLGTLLIAFGATIVAVGGSAFAAAGDLFLFALMLSVGVTVMFVGFLRASRQRKPLPAPVQTS